MKKGDRVYARDLTKDLGLYKQKRVNYKHEHPNHPRYRAVLDTYIKSEGLLSTNGFIGICKDTWGNVVVLKHKPNHIVDLEEVKTL